MIEKADIKDSAFYKTVENYNFSKLKSDLIAGLSVAALSLPQNMAYALIIGVDPVYGIYATIVSMILFTFVGVSNFMIVGPTNIMAMSLVVSLNNVSDENYLAALFLLTFMVGIFQLIFSFLKFGKFVNYISHSLIVGLSTGAVVMIAVSQFKNFVGIEGETGTTIFSNLYVLITNLDLINPLTVMTGTITILTILFLQKLNSRLPAYLIALILSGVIVYFFKLKNQIAVVGQLPTRIINFEIISFQWKLIYQLSSKAFSIAIIGLIQTLAVVKSISLETDEEIDMNREFMGQGLINTVGSFFNSFAVSASFAKSYTNIQVGAKSRFSQFTAAISVIIILLIFKRFISYIPIAGLAGLVIVVAIKSVDLQSINQNLKTTRGDAVIFLLTFLATIMLPSLESAIYIGLIVSFVVVLKKNEEVNLSILDYEDPNKNQINENHIESIKDKKTDENYIIINISGDLHFISSENLKEKLDNYYRDQKDYILRLRDIERMDITIIREIESFIKKVHSGGNTVFLSGLNSKNYERLKDYGLLNKIKEENLYFSANRLFEATKKAHDNAVEKNEK
jgi:SulP family sulfate permease